MIIVPPFQPKTPDEELKEDDSLKILERYLLEMLDKGDDLIEYLKDHKLEYSSPIQKPLERQEWVKNIKDQLVETEVITLKELTT